jgi:uncharacterized protein (UPF0332 family)
MLLNFNSRGINMLTWEQWREKSQSSLAAAQILLEHDKPVEAASRSYYAAYQMITAVLIKLDLYPRSAYGNWSHHDTQDMYRIHICQKADLGFKEKRALKNLIHGFRNLLEMRYRADYASTAIINLPLISSLWRDASRLVNLLNALIKRGML